MILAGFVLPWFAPRALPVAMVLSVGAAVLGAAVYDRSGRAIARSALLIVSAFSYPFFLGGTVLTGVTAIVATVLTVAGWVAPVSWRAGLIPVQASVSTLGVGLAAAAAQALFPQVAVEVSIGAVAVFALTAWCVVPSLRGHDLAVAAAIVLVLVEGLSVLHALPTHWAVNGAVIGLAFAAAVGEARVPRVGYAALLVVLLVSGSIQ
jgi:hypothetical protein